MKLIINKFINLKQKINKNIIKITSFSNFIFDLY